MYVERVQGAGWHVWGKGTVLAGGDIYVYAVLYLHITVQHIQHAKIMAFYPLVK